MDIKTHKMICDEPNLYFYESAQEKRDDLVVGCFYLQKTTMFELYFGSKLSQSHFYKSEEKISFEPDSNQRPKDICIFPLQSSALPTELSKDSWNVEWTIQYKSRICQGHLGVVHTLIQA